MLKEQPNTRRAVIFAVIAAVGVGASAYATTLQESPRMEASVTAESAIRFLNHFEDLAMREDFSLLEDMIDERAYFRFNVSV